MSYQIKKQFIVLALPLVTLLSCERDREIDTNSPAFQIQQSEQLTIPAEVDLPVGNHIRIATYYAEGVQKYKAQLKPGSAPAVYEWVFVAPQADLYDASNNKIGNHSAGPTWQLSPADSIYAQQFTPARNKASNEPNTIDWLLLMPKTGKTPTGIFSGVAFIQRIATKGGKAPLAPPANPNETVEIKYTAVYRFSK